MKKINKPILITGCHRSGSTWVGKMLSLPVRVIYVSEPFNPGYGLKVFKNWFKYNNPNSKIPSDKEFSKGIKKHKVIDDSVRIVNSVKRGIKKIKFINNENKYNEN